MSQEHKHEGEKSIETTGLFLSFASRGFQLMTVSLVWIGGISDRDGKTYTTSSTDS